MTRTTTRVFALVCLVLVPSFAGAGVRVVTGPDGRKAIVDDGSAVRVRPSGSKISIKLREVPDPDLEPVIAYHSEAQDLDPKLVMAVIQAESNYNARAVSNKGAMGLMQLTAGTAKLLKVSDPFDPDENIRGGTTYLRKMIDRFAGQLELAVAAYNAGPGAVERHGGIPPFQETRNYVRRVLGLYNGADVALPAVQIRPSLSSKSGRKLHLVRNAQNRLVLTTALGGGSR
ncbi:MAG TPA: lytic transglycosylase domain-containing protein [Thermoanaerobaculia bacterium]|nr:lytic transglycosylase domain-containing protein [Thermoanaerobaculia bacterium]